MLTNKKKNVLYRNVLECDTDALKGNRTFKQEENGGAFVIPKGHEPNHVQGLYMKEKWMRREVAVTEAHATAQELIKSVNSLSSLVVMATNYCCHLRLGLLRWPYDKSM